MNDNGDLVSRLRHVASARWSDDDIPRLLREAADRVSELEAQHPTAEADVLGASCRAGS
jgi:hypothetical protein